MGRCSALPDSLTLVSRAETWPSRDGFWNHAGRAESPSEGVDGESCRPVTEEEEEKKKEEKEEEAESRCVEAARRCCPGLRSG